MKNIELKYKRLVAELGNKYPIGDVPLTPSKISLDKDPLQEAIKFDSLKPLVKNMKQVSIEKVISQDEEPEHLNEIYPKTDIKRFEIVAKLKSWFIKWKNYAPVKYTSQAVLLKPEADLDLIS